MFYVETWIRLCNRILEEANMINTIYYKISSIWFTDVYLYQDIYSSHKYHCMFSLKGY
jgi:hypothetical protein